MKIEKKIWPEYFEAILAGKKKFELRLADFDVKKGDILVLREWEPKTKEYTGRILEKEAVYIIKTKNLKFWPDEKIKKFGYQIISFE